MRHLDDIYRDHYQLYHTASGKVHDSRKINWREVDWENVVKIETCIKGKKYVVSLDKRKGTIGFLCFRWAGVNNVYDKNNLKWVSRKINYWTVGYILPRNKCILTDIDFHTGKVMKEGYKGKTGYYKAHVHPRLKPKLNVKSKIIY